MTIGEADILVEKPGTTGEGSGQNPSWSLDGASNVTARREHPNLKSSQLMEVVVERGNMILALQRVKSNKGSAGVDGMSLADLGPFLKEQWLDIKEELLSGRYKPNLVRKVEIPKPGGKGVRMLGIPTVLDRLIQQALNQVMQPIFDQGFSKSSYGFRPNRSAHQAVRKARAYVSSGRRWIVDMDLEKFFDRVNHDILMSRVAQKIGDQRVLGLLRRYLKVGMMFDGEVSQRSQGTPQGGPISPLLSNILLDDLDKELERRGHMFCRYADDCNIYVASKRAGERVLASLTQYLEEKLKLQVNQNKSAVDRPWKRKFLGYSMTHHMKPRLKVADASVKRLEGKLRDEFRKGRGRNLGRFIKEITPILHGWVNYFQLAEVKGVFERLDGWIRRKLRCVLWRQWKRPYTRARNLMKRGLKEERAWRSVTNQRGPWWNSGASHMNAVLPKRFFDRLGLVSLLNQLQRLQYST